MFVKICGFTDPTNLCRVCDAQTRPDAVGLNRWAGSKRFVSDVDAAGLATLPGRAGMETWGVFVNPSQTLLKQTSSLRLDGVQLHGDEPPDAFFPVLRLRPAVRFVRAWRVRKSLGPLCDHVASASRGLQPHRVLLDAAMPGTFGGTGQKLDWHALREELD
ncbi:MAG: hypothetical protein AAF907_04470, partial [Planctomycetota bacterium]